MDIRTLDGDTAASPQIAPADLEVLKARGFRGIVNNRPDGEEPGQPDAATMAAAASAAGLSYAHVPLGREPLSRAHIDAMVAALAQTARPALLYCRSGTRSTVLWALAAAAEGAEPGALIAQAAEAGYDLSPYADTLGMLAGDAAPR